MTIHSFKNLWAIVDIDGTISDCSHRIALAHTAVAIRDPEKRGAAWDDFHRLCPDDPPHIGEVMICRAWIASGGRLAYVTGRHTQFRALTQAWLTQQGLPTTPLYMRGHSNYSGSLEYKRDMLERVKDIMAPGDVIAWVMEDQTKLVTQWRALGLTCLQPRRAVYGDMR